MSATRPLVRMKLVQIEAMLTALGATGSGLGDQTSSLGQRLPQPLQADLKQVGYIGRRVMDGGSELDDVDTQRFQLLTERVVAALEQVQASAPPSSGSWRPDSPELPVWAYFTEGVMKHYADFGGRAHRREYWMFVLFHVICSISARMMDSIFFDTSDDWIAGSIISSAYSLVIFLPFLALAVRRLHDVGRDGVWLLIVFVPVFGLIALNVFLATEGMSVANKWGPNPKGVTEPTRAF